eukprot:5811174-Amphidinium_carterae.2
MSVSRQLDRVVVLFLTHPEDSCAPRSCSKSINFIAATKHVEVDQSDTSADFFLLRRCAVFSDYSQLPYGRVGLGVLRPGGACSCYCCSCGGVLPGAGCRRGSCHEERTETMNACPEEVQERKVPKKY